MTTSDEQSGRGVGCDNRCRSRHSQGHSKAILCAGFNPDGSRVVTASDDRTARVWDVKTGAQLLVFDDTPVASDSVPRSSPGRVLCVECQLGRIGEDMGRRERCRSPQLPRPRRGCVLGDVQSRCNARGDVRRGPDGDMWDAVTAAELFTLTGHTGEIRSAAFSPDGTRIVTASQDKSAKICGRQDGDRGAVTRRTRTPSFRRDVQLRRIANHDEQLGRYREKSGTRDWPRVGRIRDRRTAR